MNKKKPPLFDKIDKILFSVGVLFLCILLFFFLYRHDYDLLLDSSISLAAVILFYMYRRELHQNTITLFFFITTLLLHNAHLYGTTPFGVPFDHYMHFYAGFALAFIADRLLVEKMHPLKHAFFIVFVTLGLGSLGEIIEWLGYGILGSGKGFFFFGIGDEGEWRNAALDMIFNTVGALIATIICFFRQNKNQP